MLSKLFGRKSKPLAPPEERGGGDADLFQKIGRATVAEAHDDDGRFLLYSEVEDGVISADIFSQKGNEPVRFRFASADLQSLIYTSWEALAVSKRWATMTYTIDDGRFECAFGYGDALDSADDTHDQRLRVVKTYFGDTDVDYSSPD